jgi:hypothetical protein
MTKFTLAEVKVIFEAEGYSVLSTEYKGVHAPIEYVCPAGHKSFQSLTNFKAGKRCKYCANNVRFTIEQVTQIFKDNGYTLLDKKYKNARTSMNCICSEGHHIKLTLDSLNHGCGCSICANNQPLEQTYVEEFFRSHGYTMLSEYRNRYSPIKCRCPNGHEIKVRWATFRNTAYCHKCGGGVRLEYAEVYAYFESKGCTLLSEVYENVDVPLDYVCSCGNRGKTSFSAFKRGVRCGCGYKSGEENPKWNPNKSMEDRILKRY